MRGNERMILHCWQFSIQGTFIPCKLTLGHNEMDSNTNILVISFHSTYSSLKTMWRCSSSANIWLWSSKTPLKQSRVIIILNKKSGSRIWYSLYKGWESVSSLHYDMRFTAVKEREQSDKWSSTITTLKTASIFHSYALYSELHPLILLHPWSQKGLAGHCWGLSSEMCHKTDYRLKLCFK